MLQLRDTRITRAFPANVAPGVIIPDEGIPLVYVKVDGETYVKPAAGTAGEIFAGVSLSRAVPPTNLPLVFDLDYDVAGGKLPRKPIAGQILVTNKADGTTRTVGTGAAASGTIQVLADGTWAMHSSDADQSFRVQMQYVPDVLEAQQVLGDMPIGGLPSTALGQIGAIKVAEISTNFFNAGVDWTTALYVKLGAGVFTVGSAADHIPGVVVKNSPSAENGFLTLSLNVA